MILRPFFKTNIRIVNIKNHIPTEYDFYVGRPSILGNIYSHKVDSIADHIVNDRDDAIDLYGKYFYSRIEDKDEVFIGELNKMLDIYKKNKKLNITCWCFPNRCHGDIIKEYLEQKIISEY